MIQSVAELVQLRRASGEFETISLLLLGCPCNAEVCLELEHTYFGNAVQLLLSILLFDLCILWYSNPLDIFKH